MDQAPTYPAAVACFLPAAGIARDASLARDAGAIAWEDDGGAKVAGSPTTTADPCVLASAPAVISATGAHPSVGRADVTAFLPTPAAARPRPRLPARARPSPAPGRRAQPRRPPKLGLAGHER